MRPLRSRAGQLGNNQQLRSEFELLYNTEIFEIQQTILKHIVKPYLNTVAEQEGKLWLKDVELGFKNIVPVSYKGDLDINRVLTVNDGRELLGYEAIEEQSAEEMIDDDAPRNEGVFKRFVNWIKRK